MPDLTLMLSLTWSKLLLFNYEPTMLLYISWHKKEQFKDRSDCQMLITVQLF